MDTAQQEKEELSLPAVKWPKHYRYEANTYTLPISGLKKTELTCFEYNVIKETSKGYWLDLGFGDQSWVSKTSKKRLAYPTKREAIESFIARKNMQIKILSSQLENAENAKHEALKLVDTL